MPSSPVPPPEPPITDRLARAKTFAILLMLLVSISAGFLGGWLGSMSRSRQGVANTNEIKQVVLSESQLIADIAKKVGPSVVSVNVTSQTTSTDFFGFGQAFEQQSAGTGFIVSSDGVIVTNRHVVPPGTTTVAVTLADGTKLDKVEIIGRTSGSDSLDIAFLKVTDKKGKDLIPVSLGDSSKVQVGDKVIAIGNALGQFQNTVTSGIISGFGRSVEAVDAGGVETLQNLFQTDTAINQGNSGGPLVNLNGEVIGINTAVAGDAENIGFSIPVDDIKGLVKSVIDKGELLRPYLGVRYVSLTDDFAFENDLKIKRGAYIIPGNSRQPSILPGSPAEKAGLKEKDIITKINDVTIDEKNSLAAALTKFSVDDTVTMTIIRDDQETTLSIKLEAAPAD